MTSIRLTIAAVLALSSPALAADCVAHLDLMDEVLDQAAETAIAESTGGQAVAGAREAQAVAGTDSVTAEAGPAGDPEAGEPLPDGATGLEPEAEASDRVQQLRAAVDAARADAGQDEAACRETLVTALRAAISGSDAMPKP